MLQEKQMWFMSLPKDRRMNMKHYKITAWAMVLAAACMTGCSEKQLSDIPISENSSSITTENEIPTLQL